MVKQSAQPGRYQLWLEAEVHAARNTLPGNVRQRVKRLLSELTRQPRPDTSQPLDTTGLEIPAGVEIRRIRMEHWRIFHAVQDTENWIWVLAILQRPPYAYEDLPAIGAKLAG